MGFVNRQYLYPKKTISESYDELRKKNEELEDIVGGDLNFKDSKVSRVSWRNTIEIKEYTDPEEEEVDFFFNFILSNGYLF